MLSRALKEHQANQAVQREKQGILIFTQSNRNFFGFVVREQLFATELLALAYVQMYIKTN